MANKKLVSELSAKFGLDKEVLNTVLDADDDAESDNFKKVTGAIGTYQIFSQDDFNTRIENEKTQAKKEGIAEGTGNSYGAMDKRIQQEFGIDKQEGEKTIDYAVRVLKEKAEKSGSKPNEELERMKSVLKDKEDALTKALAKADEIETTYKAKEQQLVIDQEISSEIGKIKIKADEKYLPSHQKLLKMEFLNTYERKTDDSGKPYWVEKATGKAVKDPRTADYLPINKIMETFAPNVVPIAEDVRKRGNGLQDTPITQTQAEKGEYDYSRYDSVDQFKQHLTVSGISVYSEQGQQALGGYLEHTQKAEA